MSYPPHLISPTDSGHDGIPSLQPPYPLSSGETWIAEAATSWEPTIPEKLVHCLWVNRCWQPHTLCTLDGREMTVHTPGRWNLHAGPDFQQAVLTFANGERCRGDVEIHRYASGWTAHQHHRDPRYNTVMLHVCLWNDRAETTVTRADGNAVPQVELTPWLPHPIETYYADIALDDYPRKHLPLPGHCYTALKRLSPQQVQTFLNQAGDARLYQRVWRWARRSADVKLAQVMYEAVLRSLGSTGYRQQFQDLARVMPWQSAQEVLQDVPPQSQGVAAEALLLGMAGLLPETPAALAQSDDDTQRYGATLLDVWQRFPETLRQHAWPHRANWRQPNVRPANTPQRRLAGVAQLLVYYHGTTLLDAAVACCRAPGYSTSGRARCQALTRLLTPPMMSYWLHRTHFGSRQGRTQRLIGPSRAQTIVVDALLPVLLLYARQQADRALQADVMACYQAAPRLPSNHLLRDMARRLLGDDPELLALVVGARQQQGLLQVWTDFCGNDEGDCQGCEFPIFPVADRA